MATSANMAAGMRMTASPICLKKSLSRYEVEIKEWNAGVYGQMTDCVMFDICHTMCERLW